MTDVTHNARIVLTRALNDRVIFDVRIRKLGDREDLDCITTRVTLSESGLRSDIGHPNCWRYSIRDHRYVLAKVRDSLASAMTGNWLDLQCQESDHRATMADLREEV